ncbi:MAG: hypothetical protein BGO32_00090 [Bacteroidetes bacterium 37-13]|nr:MAG: hypothetical protein BGO32_00090 [Bacteroidetes bacterium 37-13]
MKQLYFIAVLILVTAGGCQKEKCSRCNSTSFKVTPFIERYAKFECNSNDEYTYIFRRKAQIDSLEPNCYIINSIAFPLDETDMTYIIVGRLFEHYKDTFKTVLINDTCNKVLSYEVTGIQRDTIKYCCPYGVNAVSSVFCSVENIPADYQVEVKYKYVPLGE